MSFILRWKHFLLHLLDSEMLLFLFCGDILKDDF